MEPPWIKASGPVAGASEEVPAVETRTNERMEVNGPFRSVERNSSQIDLS